MNTTRSAIKASYQLTPTLLWLILVTCIHLRNMKTHIRNFSSKNLPRSDGIITTKLNLWSSTKNIQYWYSNINRVGLILVHLPRKIIALELVILKDFWVARLSWSVIRLLSMVTKQMKWIISTSALSIELWNRRLVALFLVQLIR